MTDTDTTPSPLTEEHLSFLRGVDSATLANAIERFGVRDRSEGFVGGAVRCLFPDIGVMVGRAVTARMTSHSGPLLPQDTTWRMWEALDAAPRPSVLVVQDASGAPTRCAYFGDVTATLALRLGAVGVVTDGGVRDTAQVRALGFHFFAAHEVVSHGNNAVIEVGAPVALDGQTVRTGDLLHGDANGVVIVPAALLAELPAAVDEVRLRERRLMDYAQSDGFTLRSYRDLR